MLLLSLLNPGINLKSRHPFFLLILRLMLKYILLKFSPEISGIIKNTFDTCIGSLFIIEIDFRFEI